MGKIGIHYDLKDDFDHPKVPEGNKLKKRVLYRLTQKEWQAK